MSFEVHTSGGPSIHLRSLDQSFTYEGLLEGLPTSGMNQRLIEGAVATAAGQGGSIPYLITPEEKPISYHGKYPFGTPASIPPVRCISRWISYDVEGFGPDADYTELVIVWFQNEMALPIAPEIILQLQRLDWRLHAAAREC